MRILAFLAALAALLSAGTARAQSTAQPVVTGYLTTSGCPQGWTGACFVQFGAGGGGGGGGAALTTTNLSTTIAVTNTFQSIQVLTAGRKGCLIQNNSGGSNNQWVFFGAIGSATKAASFLLSPGGSIGCSLPSGVLTDQISITGTAADTFVATVQ